jgi:hypothetical protein
MLIVALLTHKDESEYKEETNWKRLFALLDAVVPSETLLNLKASFEKEETSWMAIYSSMSPQISKVVASTIMLGFGFVVHTFLL